jgi:hypothetical protein
MVARVGSQSPGTAVTASRYCFCFTVVDSEEVVFSTGVSGLEGSTFTSVLRELLVDSVVVLGAGACAGAAVTAAGAGVAAGVCSQLVSISPMAAKATVARIL